MCKLNTMLINLNLCASVLQLTVISIDRCISIVYPVWCRNHRTPRLASFVVLAIWILALVFSPPFFIFRDTHSFNTTKMYCIYKFDGDNLRSEVASSREMGLLVTRFIITFFIPFTIIVSCYIIITKGLSKGITWLRPVSLSRLLWLSSFPSSCVGFLIKFLPSWRCL